MTLSHFERQKSLLRARADGAFQNFIENFNNLIQSKIKESDHVMLCDDNGERGGVENGNGEYIETNNMNNASLHSKLIKDDVEQKIYADNMITAIHGLEELCTELRSYVLSIENTDHLS